METCKHCGKPVQWIEDGYYSGYIHSDDWEVECVTTRNSTWNPDRDYAEPKESIDAS